METFPNSNDPAWTLEDSSPGTSDQSRRESRFALGNGYLGFRAATEERLIGEHRLMTVAGIFDRAAGDLEVPEAPALADVLAIELEIDGERCSVERSRDPTQRTVLDFRTGEVTRASRWVSPTTASCELRSGRIASLDDRHVVASYIEIDADDDVSISIRSGIDGESVGRGIQHLAETWSGVDGPVVGLDDRTIESGVDIAVRSGHRIQIDGAPVDPPWRGDIGRRSVTAAATVELRRGSTLRVEKVSTVHTSFDPDWDEVDARAAHGRLGAHLHAALELGYEQLARRSAERWSEYWRRHDVQVDAHDPRDQQAVRFSLFHLRCLTPVGDDRVGVSPKGFTGDGYKGHAFWDTEVYVLPFWQYTDPELAEQLLAFRVGQLPAARELAARRGYQGAMYPWESASLAHGEVTPTRGNVDVRSGERDVIRTGLLQHHITAVVAHALWRHMRLTGGDPARPTPWAEVIIEAARFWVSRFDEEPDGGLHVLDSIGPDEYSEHVDDNAFTLHLAHWCVREAIDLRRGLADRDDGRRLLADLACTAEEAEGWATALGRLALPQPGSDGLIPQDRTYLDLPDLPELEQLRNAPEPFGIFRTYSIDELSGFQVSKQADLVVLFHLLPDLFDARTQLTNLRYYESKTLHDSSLSASMYALVALRLGASDVATRLWPRVRDVDVGPSAECGGGLHAAAMGGLWQVVVNGYGGLRIESPGVWTLRPSLPPDWSSLDVAVRHGDHDIAVHVDATGASLSCATGVADLVVNGRALRIGSRRVAV